MDNNIPEPDWEEFRTSVRDQLLSRSIQRSTAVRRWTGWAIRPATAWALSLMLTVGLTTVAVMWRMEDRTPAPAVVVEAPLAEPVIGAMDAVPDKSLFDDLSQLGDEEQDQLRHMLETAQKEPLARQ